MIPMENHVKKAEPSLSSTQVLILIMTVFTILISLAVSGYVYVSVDSCI